jgi:predicted amidohydrolase YtcJ
MVVVQRPDGTLPLRSLVQQDVHVALASGRGHGPFAVLAWATSAERGAEALTMEQAVTAFTRGAAYAELMDRDKGHVSVGALADLMVPSVDPFTASADHLLGARSVLTFIGGRSVHDVP